MTRTRTATSALLALVLLVGFVSQAAAATVADPLVGTIDSITEGTDGSGNTIIIVDYTDTDGNPQTRELSLSEAEQLGLITVDPNTGDFTIVGEVGATIDLTLLEEEVDPCAASGGESLTPTQPDEVTTAGGGGGGHPVAGALCEFFQGSLGVDYDTIFGWHEDGNGFGVIARALFMAEILDVDPELILDAKKSGDYSGLGLPEDADINNWGQFQKFVLVDEVKSRVNLGAVMSGRGQPASTETPTEEPTLGAQTDPSLLNVPGSKGHGKNGDHGKKGEHGKGKGK